MTQVKNQGSVVGFVMVGLVLAALVVGGIYVTRTQLSERLAGGPDVEQAADEVVEEVEDAVTPDGDTDTEEPVEDEPAPQPEEDVAEDEAEVAGNDAPSDEVPANDDEQLAHTGVDSSADDEMPTTGVELPQTGAGDLLLSALPVAAILGATIAYRRSSAL